MTGVFTNPGNVKAESHTQREGDKDTGNGQLATNPGDRPGASSRLSEGTTPHQLLNFLTPKLSLSIKKVNFHQEVQTRPIMVF